jgi:CubicO group peptidase (beta-lactamase class C family)
MTINFSSGNDIIVPTGNSTYRGLIGDDTYIISKATSINSSITIIDTKGLNIIQLIDGLIISSVKFSSDAFKLILSNGAVVTINGANNFFYEVGGNLTSGVSVNKKSFLEFSKLFGIESLPEEGLIDGDKNLVIKKENLVSNNTDFSWSIKTPESIGLETIEVNNLMDFIKTPAFNTQAAILIQGGNIIAEYYGEGYDKTNLVTSWSVAKSFTSTLIGVAIDEGYINSIDDPITDYLPEWKGKDQDSILLKHLLSMRSGMEDHPFAGVIFSADMVKYSLGRDIVRPPGKAFSYSNEDSMLLGEILENATGSSVQNYADEKLFNILDVEDKWWTDQAGNTVTYSSLDMTPRDFAKFGLMIAQDGKWENKEIVSSDWLEIATVQYDGLASYGFQWWTSNSREDVEYNFFSARGLDGQLIYVWPETDLVFVRFTNYEHIGDKDSSVIDITISYQDTDSGNLPTTKLEELLYNVGDNLIISSDTIVTNDFG